MAARAGRGAPCPRCWPCPTDDAEPRPSSCWSGSTRARPAPTTDEPTFGRALAALHRRGAPCFGREDRRTTGSRGLPNEPCATWAEFYATQRLLPARPPGRATAAPSPDDAIADLERLGRPARPGRRPAEPPARLHGDLWAGNRLVDRAGRSWLIDPAAHGGHREFDLAMMRLFGGFGPRLLRRLRRGAPAAPTAGRTRSPLHQIAPLVVHAIKFGGGYVGRRRRRPSPRYA